MRWIRFAFLLTIVLGCTKSPIEPPGTGGTTGPALSGNGGIAGGTGGITIPVGTGGSIVPVGTGGSTVLVGTGGSTVLVGTGGHAQTGGTSGQLTLPAPQDGGWPIGFGGSGGALVIGSGGAGGGMTTPVGGANGAALVVTPSTVNLGTLDLNESGVAALTVTNTGKNTSGPLILTPSSGLTTSGCSGPLDPATSCTFTIVATPTAIGAFSGMVTITATPGAVTPLIVSVVANVSVHLLFKVSPATIDLGNIAVGVAAPRQTITVTAGTDISDLTYAASGPDVSIDKAVSTCTPLIARGASCTIAANFVASTPGAKSEGVVISGGGAAGLIVTVPIAAVAQNPAKLAINPSTPQAFAAAVGQTSSTINFIVANIGDVPTGAISAALTGPDAAEFVLTSTCLVLAPLSGCSVSVAFKPSAADGGAVADATLAVSDTGAGASQVAVALSGVRPSLPSLTISASASDLGSVVIGATGTPAVFTVANTGDAATGALAVAVSSTEFLITSDACTGQTLAPNGTCMVSIALEPTTAGAKTATLVVTGSDNKPAVMAITGTGTTSG